MKTYTTKFTDFAKFDKFITKNSAIFKYDTVLVQIFSGKLERLFLENLLCHIQKKIPKAKIIGATTDGEMIEDKVLIQSIVISITVFEKTTLTIGYIDNIEGEDSFSLGERIALKLEEPNSKVFILFTDSRKINGEDFLSGVLSEAKNITIAGGIAGDNGTFSGSYLMCENKVLENGVVGVSLNSKELEVHTQYSFAWENIGREFIVNKAEKNRVYEIDKMTPVALYSKYLGEEVASLLPHIGIEFPLVIQEDGIEIARAVLGKEKDGSLTFAGNIKEGARVRFGVGNINLLVKDSKNLALETSFKNCESIFVYSCMARRRFLENQADIDVKYLSKLATVSGFFTYGEFFSYQGDCKLLNESMTILALSEKKNKKVNLVFEDDITTSNHMTTLQALSHLANITSKELDSINHTLEEKVVCEIEKNLEYEKKVFDSMKMASLGDMIANIAHQWRQPLSVITTSASAMQLNKELGILDDKLFIQYTDMMISQAMYLSETINTFRDFIREEHKYCDVILQNEINNTIKILDVVLKDNGIKLIKNLEEEKPIVLKLVMGELSQVIINIINNAKDALNESNESNKWIKLELSSTKDRCIITIEDNGLGIPDDILPRIFEQNFTTKNKSIGTGIGLYMSYNIIVKHLNGSLYALNTEHGAKFCIELPLHL